MGWLRNSIWGEVHMCINLLFPYKYVKAHIFLTTCSVTSAHVSSAYVEQSIDLPFSTKPIVSTSHSFPDIDTVLRFVIMMVFFMKLWVIQRKESLQHRSDTDVHMRETVHFDISAVCMRYSGELFRLVFFGWLRSCLHTIGKLQVFDVLKAGNGFTQGYESLS